MPLLFSYGMLQDIEVQLLLFGRLLEGQMDELVKFELSLVNIEDDPVEVASGNTHYANAKYNGRNDSRVRGTVYEITDSELAAADLYERTAAYTRITVTLASGKQAWVYVHEPSEMPPSFALPPRERSRRPR